SRVGKNSLRPGDIWVVNQPQASGNHLPDVKVIRPIFVEGRIIAFAISLAHWSDVGGGCPGSYDIGATDLWQEGLQIPPVRVMQKDCVVADVLSLIMANVRGVAEREADLFAQIAAVRRSDARVTELACRFGPSTFCLSLDAIISLSERQIRNVIEGIPDGIYSGDDYLDG